MTREARPGLDPGETRLIVIRGNSASGKTTMAAALQKVMGRGTANVGQDHLRRVVLREHEVPGGDNIGLIAQTVRYCLGVGYHVILEGMLRASHYREMLDGLIEEHRGPTHVFYLDVTLDETLRRHQTRPMSADVPPERLREWYQASDLLGLPGEVVLDGAQEMDDTIRRIRGWSVGPLPPRSSSADARFF